MKHNKAKRNKNKILAPALNQQINEIAYGMYFEVPGKVIPGKFKELGYSIQGNRITYHIFICLLLKCSTAGCHIDLISYFLYLTQAPGLYRPLRYKRFTNRETKVQSHLPEHSEKKW